MILDLFSPYVLDANVFIQAHRRFYALDFCPGFWSALVTHYEQGRLCSIDHVSEELKRGGDDLWRWADGTFGQRAFGSTATPEVTGVYAQMLEWVMAQTQFNDAAKNEYQSVADGWLAAYAKANGGVVVTLEEYDPQVRKRVPLPNVCRAFDVEWITPFEMLRRLEVRLDYRPQDFKSIP